jgi:hypothetical protein
MMTSLGVALCGANGKEIAYAQPHPAGFSKACLITGAVMWTKDHATVHLRTPCPIDIRVEGAQLTLQSRRWVVHIAIPPESGVQTFEYRWGQAEAQVGEHTVNISYGPVGGV